MYPRSFGFAGVGKPCPLYFATVRRRFFNHLRWSGTGLIILASWAGATETTAPTELVDRRALFDRPFVGESIALAPDGRHVAYSEVHDDRLWLSIADLEHHTRKEIKLEDQVSPAAQSIAYDAEARTVTYPFLHAERRFLSRGQLRCLRWLSTNDLLIQGQNSSVIVVHPEGAPPVVLWDRMESGALTTGQVKLGEYVALPARVLPGLPEDPNGVLIQTAANTSHGTFANVYRVNVQTGEADFAGKDQRFGAIDRWSARDGALFDRRGWLRIDDWRENERRQPTFYYQDAGAPELPGSSVIPSTLDDFLGQRKKHEFEVSPDNYFGERSFPIAFDYDPQVLYIASNVGRNTFGLYSLNLKTKHRVALTPANLPFDLSHVEPGSPDDTLVFDDAARRLVGVRIMAIKAFTHWLDPDLADLQGSLDKTFAGQTVEILQWDKARAHFLVRVSREDHPGQYILYTAKEGKIDVLLDRAPWLTAAVVQPSSAFIFTTSQGVHLSGYITLPQKPRLTPPPLVVYCEGGPWSRSLPGFHREAQNLAASGAVVLRLNYRGTRGFGRAFIDDFIAQPDATAVSDIITAVDWLAAKYSIQRKRMTIFGDGFGGYVANRALQLHPEMFRCGVAINSPTDLPSWGTVHSIDTGMIEPISAGIGDISNPIESPEVSAANTAGNADSLFQEAVEHLPPPLPNALLDFGSEVRHALVARIRSSNASLVGPAASGPRSVLVVENTQEWDGAGSSRPGLSLQFFKAPGEFKTGSPQLRNKIYSQIEEFLNLNLYDFKVNVGIPQKLDDPVAPERAPDDKAKTNAR